MQCRAQTCIYTVVPTITVHTLLRVCVQQQVCCAVLLLTSAQRDITHEGYIACAWLLLWIGERHIFFTMPEVHKAEVHTHHGFSGPHTPTHTHVNTVMDCRVSGLKGQYGFYSAALHCTHPQCVLSLQSGIVSLSLHLTKKEFATIAKAFVLGLLWYLICFQWLLIIQHWVSINLSQFQSLDACLSAI